MSLLWSGTFSAGAHGGLGLGCAQKSVCKQQKVFLITDSQGNMVHQSQSTSQLWWQKEPLKRSNHYGVDYLRKHSSRIFIALLLPQIDEVIVFRSIRFCLCVKVKTDSSSGSESSPSHCVPHLSPCQSQKTPLWFIRWSGSDKAKTGQPASRGVMWQESWLQPWSSPLVVTGSAFLHQAINRSTPWTCGQGTKPLQEPINAPNCRYEPAHIPNQETLGAPRSRSLTPELLV